MALTKKEQARSTPRDKRDKDSWEYAYQTLTHLKEMYAAKAASQRRFEETIEQAEEAEIYKRLPEEDDPYGDLDTMLKQELGTTKAEAIREASAWQSDEWETEDGESLQVVVDEESGTALREHGGDRGNQHTGGRQDDYNNLGSQGTSSSYWAARLKKDAPDYHESLQRGEYDSVRQAAIDAGLRKEIHTKQIRETDEPKRAAEKVREVYDADTISGLIKHLQNHA